MAIHVLLRILAVYFLLSSVMLAVLTVFVMSKVDLPLFLYPLSILVLPLVWLGRLLEPPLSMLGLWSNPGPGGCFNYEGASLGGLSLLAAVGLALSVLLLLYSRHKGDW